MSFLGVSSEAWFPVITLIVGAVLKGVFDLLAEKRADGRAQKNRDDQRRDVLRLKRLEFQQATLLEFQEVISRLARFYGRAHHEAEMEFRKTGQWRQLQFSDEVNQGINIEQSAFARLRVRIRDATVRTLAVNFSDAAIAALMADSQEKAMANMMTMATHVSPLSERIGVLLRELEDSEDEIAGTGNP